MSKLTRQGGALLAGIVCALILGSQPVVAQTSSLPPGWTDGDIGAPVVAGSATTSGSTVTVVGGGTDVGGTSDEFHFAYLPSSGDLDVRVRVASLQNVDPSAKAGIMIRESLQDDARHAFMFVTPGTASRSSGGETGRMTRRPAAPGPAAGCAWCGGRRSAYSPTPATWTRLAVDGQYGASVYVGLAVTSHVPSRRRRRPSKTRTLDQDRRPCRPPGPQATSGVRPRTGARARATTPLRWWEPASASAALLTNFSSSTSR